MDTLPKETSDVLVALKYDTCECVDKCEPCKGVRQMAIAEIEELRRDNASYANAHKVLLAERDKAQQLAMRQAAQIKRMSAGETDPPHCPSCDCGRRS